MPGTQEGLTKIQFNPSSLGQHSIKESAVGHRDPNYLSGAIHSVALILFLHLLIWHNNASIMHGKAPESNFSCPPHTGLWILVLKDFTIFLLDYKPCLEYPPTGLPPTPGRSPWSQHAEPWLNPTHSSDSSAQLNSQTGQDSFPRCSQNPVMISRLNVTYYIETNCLSICLSL